jgi:phosphate transport system permease protein
MAELGPVTAAGAAAVRTAAELNAAADAGYASTAGAPPPSPTISFAPPRGARWQRRIERGIEFGLFLAASSSVIITLGIVGMLVWESVPFFRAIRIRDFLFDTQWTPTFADPRYGILPLLSGTIVTTLVALLVAVPVGTVASIWLSEYCNARLRELIKPVLELLSAVPTVVYGYFALLTVTPFLKWLLAKFGIDLPGFNMLSAGLVMGVMIIPYVASLSEDAMRAVPMSLREGSFATGATKFQTAWRVVVPSAFSGVTAAYILGVSRAIGETMIVAIAAGQQPDLTFNPLEQGMTVTAYIVQISKGDTPHGSVEYRTIFAAGLTLMLLTLAFNVGGYVIRKRYREVYA